MKITKRYKRLSNWQKAVEKYWGRQGSLSFYMIHGGGYNATLRNPFSGFERLVGDWSANTGGKVFD